MAAVVGALPIVASSAQATPSSSQLTISTQMLNGVSISGYYVALYQGWSIAATGFAPATFTVNDSQTYTVNVDNYGSCTFAYWADTGSTSSSRTVSINGSTQYPAVMNCGSTPSSVTVQSANQNGHIIGGFSTALSQNDSFIASGFSTSTFSTTAGQTYIVQANSSGNGCIFSQWSDGVANNPRSFTAVSGGLTLTAVYDCATTTSSVSVNSINQGESSISGSLALEQNDTVVASGVTAAILTTTVGQTYAIRADSYGSCTFSKWSDGVSSDSLSFNATSGGQSFTAIYNCGAISPGSITVYAHRAPASYWAPCFATTCSAGTGPGATMWLVVYDSMGSVVATGFANENGYTFTGLNPNATYYVSPADCDNCHGSTHDVLFSYWGDNNSTTQLRAVIANGTSVNAWYTCTNGCSGF
jgi:hypothetical protein